MTVSDTTNNASGATTPATNTRFYLSTNGVLDAGDVLLGSRAVPSLAPGASSSGSVSLTIPAGTSVGTWFVIAKADGDDAVAETSEANNTQSRSVIIGPDLVVNAFTAPSGGAGQAMTVTDTIRNQGGGATPVTTTRYYLSTNGSLEAGDTLLGSRSVPGLAPGASDTGSTSLVIPAGTATGSYFIIAKADGDDALAETNETNNLYARSITVGPDLGIANLLHPSAAGAGTTFTVTDTTRNFADGAAPASTTRFYLSTNTTLDGSDVLLGSRSVGALGAGASETGATSITIPAGTAAGYYYLLAKADGDDALVETNEFNNVLVRVLQVTP
jgi:subtilase family serine protease